MMYNRPDWLHRILSVTADSLIAYLNAQIDCGAQAVMIFDTWGGSLSAAAYPEFSLQYMERIVAGLKKEKDGQRIPSIVITKNGGLWLEKIAAIGCDAVGLDRTIDIGEARRRVGDKVALQGNLDPNVLFAPPAQIVTQVHAVLDSFGQPHTDKTTTGPTHIFNLGHGISQFTPPDHVKVLVDAVHAHSKRLRAQS